MARRNAASKPPSLPDRPADPPAETVEEIELSLLLDGLVRRHGLDFRGYHPTSLRRRLRNALLDEGLGTLSELQARVLRDDAALDRLLGHISVQVTAMFRDPPFFRALRERVIPTLRAHPFVRIWHAGCATGEEAWSLAILLEEEGLYDRCRIYATDMSASALEKARRGTLPLDLMREYTANYQQAGGRETFSDYYEVVDDAAVLRPSLGRNLVFAQHNLVTDGSFNEFHLILCRNVLIYFGADLQARVHGLLFDSLRRFGVLALGNRETLALSAHEADYEALDEATRLYRKRAD